MVDQDIPILHEQRVNQKYHAWHLIAMVASVVLFVLVVLVGGTFAYAKQYEDKVLPGITVGDLPVGGMTREELTRFLNDMNEKLLAEGLHFAIGNDDIANEFVLYPVIDTDEVSIELLSIDTDKEVDRLMSIGKEGSLFRQVTQTIGSKLSKKEMMLTSVHVDEEKLLDMLHDRLKTYETQPHDAKVVIVDTHPLQFTIASSSAGIVFDYARVPEQVASAWRALETPMIRLVRSETKPQVTKEDIDPLAPRLAFIFDKGPITLTYTDPQTSQQDEWKITPQLMKEWIELQSVEGNGKGFGLNKASTTAYLEKEVSPDITVEAKNALFKIGEDGTVSAFQSSRPGITLEVEQTYKALNDVFLQRSWHDDGITTALQVAVTQVEPSVKTGEVNNLGITDILGVGISNFGNSPANRIVNIKNAIKKLNGILVKPGDTFSTVEHAKPFTLEGGYVPELVIKGDEIKPEIGGGLCQISTTLFRMAMNSGLDIVQRRNHALVVPYYNDPVNGLPGTDATIYDPSPDFKFKNDTNNYVLIETAINMNKRELIFTLWGTKDGRKASYTHPVVTQWKSPGPTRIVKTTKIAVGKRECQHAYRGADAFFIYTRTLPDGIKQDVRYDSEYRALPEICLIGVSAEDLCRETGEGCEIPATAGVETGDAAKSSVDEQAVERVEG